MKTIILAGLCALLLVGGNSSVDTPTISIAEIIDDQGEPINYNENYKTNIEDAELIRKVEEKSTWLAHAEVLYNCSSVSDIQATDMLKYIEYVSHKYYAPQRAKSPVVTLSREQMEHIIQSEFGVSDGLGIYGAAENIEYVCNTAQSNMNIGVIPIELRQEGDYFDMTMLINYQTSAICMAMKYRLELADGNLHFVGATRLQISEQSGGGL